MDAAVTVEEVEETLALLCHRYASSPPGLRNAHGAWVQLSWREFIAVGVAMGAIGAAFQALAMRRFFQSVCQRCASTWTSLDTIGRCPKSCGETVAVVW